MGSTVGHIWVGSYMSYMGQPWSIWAIYRLSEKAGRPTGIKQRWNLGVLESGGSVMHAGIGRYWKVPVLHLVIVYGTFIVYLQNKSMHIVGSIDWTSYKLCLSAAITSLPSPPTCDVCLIAPRDAVALVPCGHARFCRRCCDELVWNRLNCPFCRTPIAVLLDLYLNRIYYFLHWTIYRQFQDLQLPP